MRLIDVILPLAIRDSYTYNVPESLMYPQPGMRVLVPLGRKQLTGIVLSSRTTPVPATIQIRDIIAVLDDRPIVSPLQLRLWQWMSRYYLCSLGEVLAAALPAGIIDDDYKARTEQYIRLTPIYTYARAKEALSRAPKQIAVLDCLSALSPDGKPVERRLVIEQSGQSTAVVRALEERGIIEKISQSVSRLTPYTGETHPPLPLSEAQSRAVQLILSEWQSHEVVLLHGVTSSGKTEVYIHLIQQQLTAGQSVLYLVPEIALTTQLTDRLHRVFGNDLVVYHSRLNTNERVEIYHRLLENNSPKLIIGVRSAVFLPMTSVGLIIVDEEHETSYKQQDPAPRYHARSVAVMLGHWLHAKVLLGTATPSIETYYNAQSGKYGLVSLTTRYAGIALPAIRLIDLQQQYHRKEMYGHFSDPLVDKIREVLSRGKQVILFQNRRGYAPMLQCSQCGHPPRCVQCDVPLTLHKKENELRCHWCGYSHPIFTLCPDCGGELKVRGFGTERLEDEVANLFPEAKVLRMDLDTTRSKTAYQDIINRFSRHECDILIGTQMVTKGLHFDDVALVAVLNADQLLNQSDFRAYERAFQMLSQVAGRAGRKGQQGEVLIQTFDIHHPVLQQVIAHDYMSLYHTQLEERKAFLFPPFHRMTDITVKHKNYATAVQAAIALQQRLKQVFGARISGVIVPSVARVQNTHIRLLRLRIEASANIAEAKRLLMEQTDHIRSVYKGTQILIDVDPQ